MFAWRNQWTWVVLGIGYLMLCTLYFHWTWSRELGDFGGDNAFYLLIAQHYSFWGDADAVTRFFSTNSLYPPLYPIVLGLFSGGTNVLAAHLTTTALLCLAFAAFFVWLRQLACTTVTAALLTLLFALLPGTYMQALSILSEGTYLLFSMLAVVAVSMHEKSSRSSWLWITAACIAATTLTRSAGITLVAAFAIYLMLHRPPRFWLYGTAAIVPFVVWNILHQSSDVGYVSALMEKRPADLITGVLEQLRVQAFALWQGWTSSFSDVPIATPIVSVLALLGFAGTAIRAWQRKFDGIYVVFYFSLIMAWPFPAEAARLLFVLIPFLLASTWWLARNVPSFNVGNTRLSIAHVALLILFLLALPELLLTAQRFLQPTHTAITESRRARGWYDADPNIAVENIVFDDALVDAMRRISRHVPEGQCVYSIKPSLVGFYAHRVSVVPPREYLDAEVFHAALKRYDCKYLFTVGFVSPSYRTPYYPMDRLGRVRVLEVGKASGFRPPIAILVERAS